MEYCKAFTNRHWAVKFAKISLITDQSDQLRGQASQSIQVMYSLFIHRIFHCEFCTNNIVKHSETWLACLRVVASVDSESADHRLQSAATQPHHFLLPAPPHAAATHTEHGPGYT